MFIKTKTSNIFLNSNNTKIRNSARALIKLNKLMAVQYKHSLKLVKMLNLKVIISTTC